MKPSQHAELSDVIPWGSLVASGILLNKDGSLQTSFRFRGPDLDSTTDDGLTVAMARINNALRRLESGWGLHVEARRSVSDHYPDLIQDPPVASIIDQQRQLIFAESGTKLVTNYYLTLSKLLPEDRTTKAISLLYENTVETSARRLETEIQDFRDVVGQIADLLRVCLPMLEPLDDAETLTYLHDCVSWSRAHIQPPPDLQFIDSYLYDTDVLPGLAPMLGDRWIKMLSIRAFPSSTVPALLDRLNSLPFEYRWTSRYLSLDKLDAEAELQRLQRHWYSKRKSLSRLLIEMLTKQDSVFLNQDAINKAVDVDEALTELAEDVVSFGYFTPVVMVWDQDHDAAKEKLGLVQREIDGLGFTSKEETFNAFEAWLSTLPGHNWSNVRRPVVSSLNLTHMVPFSAVWSGERWNNHLNAPPLLVAETNGATPFYLNLHTGDVGHTMIVGPTGSGKSTLLTVLAAQWFRYEKAKIFIFDKGGSARAVSHGVSGQYCRLGDPTSMTLQPLRDVDQEEERAFALDWLANLLHQEGLTLSPDQKEALWSALKALASFDQDERTVTVFRSLVQDQDIKTTLHPYTLDGAYGALLDASSSTAIDPRWQCFDLETLADLPGAIAPTLLAIFHILEKQFTGEPTLLILDEAWLFLDNSLFAAQIKSWLKTLRKKNVSVVFATQSLADIEQSAIASTLIDSCPQKIFLANERAREAMMADFYRRFGLNDRQLDVIANATPKSDYYMMSSRGNRLFSLCLGDVALAFCGASTPDHQKLMDHLIAEQAKATETFGVRWLDALGMTDAADYLAWQEGNPRYAELAPKEEMENA